MTTRLESIYWEAPEHNHIEKTSDWYWILCIIAIAGSVACIIFGDALFGVVILLGAATMIVASHRKPRIIPFEVGARGIRIDTTLYPYTTLESFCIDEESPSAPQLIVKSKKMFVPLLILPIPDDQVHTIDSLVGARLFEEHLEEPFSHQLLEFLGF